MSSTSLEDLRKAVERDDRPAVVRRSRDVLESFDSLGRLVERYRELANIVRYGAQPDSDPESAGKAYNEAAIELSRRRSDVDRALIQYLGSEESGDEVLSRIDTLQTAISDESEARRTLNSQKADLAVPPFVHLDLEDVVVRPKDTEIDTAAELANLGGEPTAEIDLVVSSDLPLSTSTGTIDSLQPDESVAFDIQGELSTAGMFPVEIVARGEGISARESMRLVVRDKEGYLGEAATELCRGETILEGYIDSSHGAGDSSGDKESQGQSSDLRQADAKLSTALQAVEKGIDVADKSGTASAVDSHVRTARRKLDEFFTHLDRVNDDTLADEDRTRLLSNVLDADTHLDQALDAAL